VSILVEVVVGEFQFVEGQRLLHPVRSAGRRVRVNVESARHVRLGLAGRHPLRVVVLVAAVVQRYDVHQQDVLGARIESFQRHFERRKHSPAVHTEQVGRDKRTLLFCFWCIISDTKLEGSQKNAYLRHAQCR